MMKKSVLSIFLKWALIYILLQNVWILSIFLIQLRPKASIKLPKVWAQLVFLIQMRPKASIKLKFPMMQYFLVFLMQKKI